MGCLLPVAKAAVCCADPPQLVAFVEPRKEARRAALRVCPLPLQAWPLEPGDHLREGSHGALPQGAHAGLPSQAHRRARRRPGTQAHESTCSSEFRDTPQRSRDQVCRCFPTAR